MCEYCYSAIVPVGGVFLRTIAPAMKYSLAACVWIIFCFCSMAAPVFAQGTIVNYIPPYRVYDMAGAGNYLWLATDQGVLHWNCATNAFQWFMEHDGLITNDARTVTVQNDGGVWIGSYEGASRFDGTSWETYTTAQGLPDNHVYSVVETEDGCIWFATYKGVARLANDEWTIFTMKHGLAFNSVDILTVTSDGTVWAGTVNGVSRFDGEQWLTYDTDDGLPDSPIQALIVDEDDNVWVGTSNGCACFDTENERWRAYDADDGLNDTNILSMTAGPGGTVWAAAECTIYRYDRTDDRWILFQEAGISQYDPIESIAEDVEGTVWCANWEKLIQCNEDHILSRRIRWGWGYVRDVHFTADGARWIPTSEGLCVYNQGWWKRYTIEDGLVSDNVFSVAVNDSGIVWVGFYQGLMKYDGTTWTTINEVDFTSSVSVAVDNDGNLWCGDRRNIVPLYRYDGNEWFVYDLDDGLDDIRIDSITIAPDGAVWIGTSNGISRFYSDSGEMLRHFYNATNVGQKIAFADDGSVWCASWQHGVSKYEDGHWTDFTAANSGLTSNFIGGVDVHPSGDVWIGTQNDGICVFSDGSWSTLNLGIGSILDVKIEHDETVWFACHGALLRYYPNDPLQVKKTETPTVSGIPISNYPNPFNMQTTISFILQEQGRVDAAIYSITGQKICDLITGTLQPGHHTCNWNGRDDSGQFVASGIYFVQVRAENRTAGHRILFIK